MLRSPKMSFDPSSRSKLTRRDLGRFADDSLFHRLARTVCETECLARKELYEAWEVARRTRRRFRGGRGDRSGLWTWAARSNSALARRHIAFGVGRRYATAAKRVPVA